MASAYSGGSFLFGPGIILVARGAPWTPEGTLGGEMLFFCLILEFFGCQWAVTLEVVLVSFRFFPGSELEIIVQAPFLMDFDLEKDLRKVAFCCEHIANIVFKTYDKNTQTY